MNKIILLSTAVLFLSVAAVAQDGHDHENDHENERVEQENHEGHDHGDEDKNSGTTDNDVDELTVELTPEAIKLGGILFSQVKHGLIDKTIELPGEVGFNEDRLVHIAPRFAGIAIKAHYRVGDYVHAGEIVAVVESNESMNKYSIKAPIDGWVIERHITQGEYVSEDNSIFIIADLSTVWVNLAVYQKDAHRIKKGQTAIINAIGSKNKTSGLIEYVTPIIDYRTRSATARITLENPDNRWRPGTFIQASIVTSKGVEQLVVEKNAVQILNGKNIIFVRESANKFKPVEVLTGESDQNHIQIISGLHEGTTYVSKGAFEIKAKIITSNLDAHAGHGH